MFLTIVNPNKIHPCDSIDPLACYSVPQVQENSIRKYLFCGDIDFPCHSSTMCPSHVPRSSVVANGDGLEQDALSILVVVEDTDH